MLAPIRDAATSSRAGQGRRPAAAPGAARVPRRHRPRERGRRLPARPAPARRRAARALHAATASPRRSCSPRAASSGDVVGRTHAALEAARRAAAAPGCPDRPLRSSLAMTREEVFALIQAHLADELEVDPARIDEATRFKEDLEADSLDLYTLVQELEDSYGVKMSDEEAAQDPHRGPGGRLRPRPRARHQPEPLDRLRALLGRASGRPAPAGLHARLVDRAARRTPTRAWPSWATACSAWRSRRTSTRAWRPSASAPGG